MLSQDLAETRRIVMGRLQGRANAYLYGSCARGQATRMSDIDVGIMPLVPIDPTERSGIRQALEESNILKPVDLVDLSQSDPEFRRQIPQDAIKWID